MKIFAVLLILAGLSALFFIYRQKIESWFPGYKTILWNGLVSIAGLIGSIFAFLQENTGTFGQFLTAENAALAAVVVGVVGILISYVTKRADS